MERLFSDEEQYLISCLRNFLQEESHIEEIESKIDIGRLVSMARKHSVLSFLYDEFQENDKLEEYKMLVENTSRQTVLQNYRLLFLTKYVVDYLNKHGVSTIVLKGVATGNLYSVPELRKSGDIDLLVHSDIETKQLIALMEKIDFRMAKEQHSNHHIVFVSTDGIEVEIHTLLAEPFAYKIINQGMKRRLIDCWEHFQIENIMGVELPVLDKPFHAYELLLHMFQHFVYAGFGLKLLCDWVMIWKANWTVYEKKLFRELADECGLDKFAEIVTSVCIKFLGGREEQFAWNFIQGDVSDVFLRDILDAEEFGYSDNSRMVIMSGTGILAYIKEFHHQMHLNFPMAGNCLFIWPVLWTITLVKFMRNNRKIRRTSVKDILRAAKKRSKLMERMELFK